ncbi:MAG: hypothetical protein ACJAZG_001346, partial [Granulosicoccus sp.]
ASAVDLDWFWRGWFYTTDHCDISVDSVKWFQIDTRNPTIEKAFDGNQASNEPVGLNHTRNLKDVPNTMLENDPTLKDFYSSFDQYKVTSNDQEEYADLMSNLTKDDKALLSMKNNFYQLTFSNKGGLVMPLILEFTFNDGTKTIERIPAEIWKKDNETINKLFVFEKEVTDIVLDPLLETADTDLDNNFWPPRMVPTRFELFKKERRWSEEENFMKKAKKK